MGTSGELHHVWQPLANDLALVLGEMSAMGQAKAAKVALCYDDPSLPEFMAPFWVEKREKRWQLLRFQFLLM